MHGNQETPQEKQLRGKPSFISAHPLKALSGGECATNSVSIANSVPGARRSFAPRGRNVGAFRRAAADCVAHGLDCWCGRKSMTKDAGMLPSMYGAEPTLWILSCVAVL